MTAALKSGSSGLYWKCFFKISLVSIFSKNKFAGASAYHTKTNFNFKSVADTIETILLRYAPVSLTVLWSQSLTF